MKVHRVFLCLDKARLVGRALEAYILVGSQAAV
jgi:hypothetical protein